MHRMQLLAKGAGTPQARQQWYHICCCACAAAGTAKRWAATPKVEAGSRIPCTARTDGKEDAREGQVGEPPCLQVAHLGAAQHLLWGRSRAADQADV